MVFFWPYFILFLLDILEEPSFRDRPIWENDSLICMYDMREESTNSFAWFFLGGGGGGVGGIRLDEIRTVVPLPSSCRDICKNSCQNETVAPVDIYIYI